MVMTRDDLRTAIDQAPRVSLASIPTPLHDAPALTRPLGGPRTLIKRDDLTGLGLARHTVRHLDFSLARAVALGLLLILRKFDEIAAAQGVES